MRNLLILIMLTITINASYVTDVQYKRLLSKEKYLKYKVKQFHLPKRTVMIFLGLFLRESSIGVVKISDKEEDKYYYIHQHKRVYIDLKQYIKSKVINGNRYIKVKYWGKYWKKKLYKIEGAPKPLTKASLGDYCVKFDTVLFVIKHFKLKRYYRYLSRDRKRLVNQVELVNRLIFNNRFNTLIALYYFKYNYNRAIKLGYKKPLERAISKHNGGWFNYRYIKLTKRSIKYVEAALKRYRR